MLRIRVARPEDAAALASLAERTFREAFSDTNDEADMELHCSRSFGVELQLREIRDADYVTLLGERDGRLAGYSQLKRHSPQPCVPLERPSELYRLYVDSRWHSSGVAQMLMTETLAAAATASSDGIWLGVWEHNLRAIAFYRKFGFELVGEHDFFLGQDKQRDLIMALTLDSPPAA